MYNRTTFNDKTEGEWMAGEVPLLFFLINERSYANYYVFYNLYTVKEDAVFI